MSKYDCMTYMELMEEVPKTREGKEARQLHKALKKYDGSGLSIIYRYPMVPVLVSCITLAVCIAILLLT